MKKYARKYWKLISLIVVEMVIAIGLIMNFFEEKIQIEIPYQELIGTTIPDERDGWYMDATFPCESSGIFDYTRDYALGRGSYDITVKYETNTNKNYTKVTADTDMYRSLWSDETPLNPEVTEVTYTVYLWENVEDFKIRTYFGGEGYMIIKDMAINQTNAMNGMVLSCVVFFALLIDLIYLGVLNGFFAKVTSRKWNVILGIIAVVIVSSLPNLGGYIICRQDMGFHLLRIEGIKEALLDGQFPVKMHPYWTNGYGYPVSIYYGDLFLYIPAIMRVLGFPIHIAIGTFTILTNLATAYIMYWVAHKICKNEYYALGCAVIYTLAPYRLMDMYVRCAVGETLAITFLPLIAYGIYAAFVKKDFDSSYRHLWVPMVIGFTGVIQSHVLTCVMCAIFIIIVCLLQIRKIFVKERFLVLAKTVIYTALVNSWFIVPFITEMKGIDVVQPYRTSIRIQSAGTQLNQLFSMFYRGTGDFTRVEAGVASEMAQGVGLALGLVLILFLALKIRAKEEVLVPTQEIKSGTLICGLSVFALFVTTIYCPWDLLSELLGPYNTWIANIQFPFRFIAIATVLIIMLLLMCINILRKTTLNKYAGTIIGVITLVAGITGVYMINHCIDNTSAFYAYDIEALGANDNNVKEYLIYGTDINALEYNKVAVGENVSYSDYEKDGITIRFTCENTGLDDSYIELPLLWYPHYGAMDTNGTELELVTGVNNVMRVIIPSDYEGDVLIQYQTPILWKISYVISLMTLLVLAGSVVWSTRNRKSDRD